MNWLNCDEHYMTLYTTTTTTSLVVKTFTLSLFTRKWWLLWRVLTKITHLNIFLRVGGAACITSYDMLDYCCCFTPVWVIVIELYITSSSFFRSQQTDFERLCVIHKISPMCVRKLQEKQRNKKWNPFMWCFNILLTLFSLLQAEIFWWLGCMHACIHEK